MKKQICILGSTGSIGTQALQVIEEHADLYEAYCLTANNQWQLLAEQARKFHPAAVVIANDEHYETLKQALADEPDIKVYAGRDALCQVVEAGPIDMVLTAMVGFAGLEPTIAAIKAHKKICLANKETLVVAGELICQLAQRYHASILPVDSEHSAIFQSLVGEDDNPIEKILLTASGGRQRTVAYYADKLCITAKHLSKIVKQKTGKRALEVINSHAIHQIKLDLLLTDIPISQLADKYHFGNFSFFCQFVKAHLGMTPQAYRAQRKKEDQ